MMFICRSKQCLDSRTKFCFVGFHFFYSDSRNLLAIIQKSILQCDTILHKMLRQLNRIESVFDWARMMESEAVTSTVPINPAGRVITVLLAGNPTAAPAGTTGTLLTRALTEAGSKDQFIVRPPGWAFTL